MFGTGLWPSLWRVISLQDYNTRVVVLGVAVLGCSAGLIGSFTLLRKRALMGDALSHAALPGIALAFLLASAMGYDGKSMPILLTGATISGLLGMGAILWIRNHTRLKEDAALGIVLSVFFGMGVALLGITTQTKTASAAGLESFIYGKTASMRAADVNLIIAASLAVIVLCALFFKELKLLCFDEAFTGSRGYSVVALDVLLMVMVVVITIVGLQAVGLILVIALMVIPAAAARFWTHSLAKMMFYAAALGTAGGIIGAMTSAVMPNLPSGAMIVLVCALFFFFSMLFGSSRGVLVRWLRRRKLNRRIERQHLLRAMFELTEPHLPKDSDYKTHGRVPLQTLFPERSWSMRRLIASINDAMDRRFVRVYPVDPSGNQWRDAAVELTSNGFVEAARLTRQHRLWEMYLITYADIAPGLVDRDADAIEHVLEPHVMDRLEELLEQGQLEVNVPESPHLLVHPGDSSSSDTTTDTATATGGAP